MLVPAFHFKILHDFVPVFNEHASFLVKKLQIAALKGKPVDIVPSVTACALDIICGKIRKTMKRENYVRQSSVCDLIPLYDIPKDFRFSLMLIKVLISRLKLKTMFREAVD